MTPRARERAIEPMLEGDVAGKAALKRLMVTVERARYATSVEPGSQPAEDAREVMTVITKASEPGQRLLAVVWPASLLPDLRVGWARLRARTAPTPVDRRITESSSVVVAAATPAVFHPIHEAGLLRRGGGRPLDLPIG